MSNLVEALETFFKATLDYRGRIYIPKQIREKLLIKNGEKVYMKIEKNHLEIYTAKAIHEATNLPTRPSS